MQKRAKLSAPPTFLSCFVPVFPPAPSPISCQTCPPLGDIRICQLTIERFPISVSLSTAAMLFHYSHLSLPPLFLSLSRSFSPALYSLLAIKHWAAINKLANHFQPSPRAPRCHRDSYRLLLFAFVFASFFVVSLPPPLFSLLVGVEWMLMSVVIGNWYFTKHLSFQVISESLKNKTWSGNKYVVWDNAWYIPEISWAGTEIIVEILRGNL